MKLALGSCVYLLSISSTLGFEEAASKVKRRNRDLHKLGRKKKDQEQTTLVNKNSLRSAQAPNVYYPNIQRMKSGVNVLLGKPPHEDPAKSPILNFDYQGTNNLYDTKYLHTSRNNGCEGGTTEENIFYSLSTEAMQEQSSSSSVGYDQKVDWGVEVPVGGASVSAQTTTQNTLAFGRSSLSGSLKASTESSTSFEFYSWGEKYLYYTSIDWDRVKQENGYSSYFLSKCKDLGRNPSDTDVLDFFSKFGTHAFKHATFGKRCTSLVTMKGGASKESMQEWSESSKSATAGYMWFEANSESKKTEKKGEVTESNFSYQTSNRSCMGMIKNSGGCASLEPEDDFDMPVILDYKYKPIWEMDVPLTSGAKNNMKRIVENVFKESRYCGTRHCNDRGSCPVSGRMSANVGDMIDSSTCVCDSGFVGKHCEKTDTCEFTKINNVQMNGDPIYHEDDKENILIIQFFKVKFSLTIDQCKKICLENPRCKAYSYSNGYANYDTDSNCYHTLDQLGTMSYNKLFGLYVKDYEHTYCP